MRADVTKKLFTVDEYYRMLDAGILSENDRVELIEGEIIQMSPIGNRHMACVDRANDLFTTAFKGRALVSVQNPLRRVAEVWIENLQEDLLLVCRNPTPTKYRSQLELHRGDSISPLAFPDVVFKVEELLG